MKFAPLILLLLVVKTKASFFDRFKGDLLSVESSVGKLLNDVISDVKTTVHCTILAMKQVLAVNGVMPQPQPDKSCDTDDDQVNYNIKTRKGNSYSKRNFAQDIHASISKVNDSLSHILDNTGHERIEELRRDLKHESNHLTEVSLLLRKELEKISRRMKKEFKNIDLNSGNTLDSVRNEMKLLYEVEKNDKTASEEIGQVLKESLHVLNINTPNEIKSDAEKINVIMKELERESSNKKHSQLKGKDCVLQNNLVSKLIQSDTPMNVKNVAMKSIKNVEDVAAKAVQDVKDVATKTLESGTNSENPLKGIDDAMAIFNDASKTQAILDNFFSTEHGSNAFENPNLLNFEK